MIPSLLYVYFMIFQSSRLFLYWTVFFFNVFKYIYRKSPCIPLHAWKKNNCFEIFKVLQATRHEYFPQTVIIIIWFRIFRLHQPHHKEANRSNHRRRLAATLSTTEPPETSKTNRPKYFCCQLFIFTIFYKIFPY